MSWYAAHILMYFRCKDGQQPTYDLWENIVLFEADSVAQAIKKAQLYGKEDEGDSSGTLTSFGKPSELLFAGVRKIIDCSDAEVRPGDGTEITYSTFSVQTEDEIKKLVNDETVPVIYQSGAPDE